MLQEGVAEVAVTADALKPATERAGGFAEVTGTPIGQFLSFHIAPHGFHGIEVWGVAGEPLNAQPAPLGREIRLHLLALVRRQAVPDEQAAASPHGTFQVREEDDQLFGVVAAGCGLEVEPAASAIPAIGQCRADREFLPVERVDQDWRFAFWRPGAADRGALGDPAFVLE